MPLIRENAHILRDKLRERLKERMQKVASEPESRTISKLSRVIPVTG